tara:strand:+ start:1330 stop:1806 length:477 start_codon:yes stop_codon:yes gene_type:complete
MYAKIKDGSVEKYPYSITDLKQDNPNVSFPKVLDSTVLNSFGTYEVVTDSKPTYNSVTQIIIKKSTPELVSGTWTLKWETKDKPQEDIDQEKADEQNNIRSERVMELEQCDWTVLPDAPLSEDMVNKYKTYRQQLRDITKQSTFNEAVPSVTWPTKPS